MYAKLAFFYRQDYYDLFFLTSLGTLTTEGGSETSETSETSDTSGNSQPVQGSFLNLLPPQLVVSQNQNKSA